MEKKNSVTDYINMREFTRGELIKILFPSVKQPPPSILNEPEVDKYLTQGQVRKIKAFKELYRRDLDEDKSKKVVKISRSKDIAELMRHKYEGIDTESFYCIYLNRANKVININKISGGGLSGTIVDIRVILKQALLLSASSIVVSHNHPSGNIIPSAADISVTKKVMSAAKLMDIVLLDHVIMGNHGEYTSFADEGLL